MALTEFALERMTRILMATPRPMRNVKKRVSAAVGYHAKMYGQRRSAGNLQKKENVRKEKKILEPLDTNVNFDDTKTAMECFMCNTKFQHESWFKRHMKDTHQIDFMNKTPN